MPPSVGWLHVARRLADFSDLIIMADDSSRLADLVGDRAVPNAQPGAATPPQRIREGAALEFLGEFLIAGFLRLNFEAKESFRTREHLRFPRHSQR